MEGKVVHVRTRYTEHVRRKSSNKWNIHVRGIQSNLLFKFQNNFRPSDQEYDRCR